MIFHEVSSSTAVLFNPAVLKPSHMIVLLKYAYNYYI